MSKLSEAELREAIQELSGWVDQDGKLTKTFTHSSFPEAIVFVNAVAHIAELANHHPDIDVRYSNITLSLVTHDEGAVQALQPDRVLILPDGVEDLWNSEYADLIALA